MEEVLNGNFKGKNFKTRVQSNQQKFVNVLKKQITNVVGAGLNKDAAVKTVVDKCGAAYYEADRLVRTETMRVINDGQKKAFINNGYTYGYYLVAEDDRLCDECNRIAIETKNNPVPIENMDAVHHPQCRCTIIPVIKKMYEVLQDKFSIAHTLDSDVTDGLVLKSQNNNDNILSATGVNKFKIGFTKNNLDKH